MIIKQFLMNKILELRNATDFIRENQRFSLIKLYFY